MNRTIQKARHREQYSVAETDAPVVKGEVVTKVERKRMGDWLRNRGEPNLSAFRRRR
jgi:hypothetical protein